jgi:chromatin assembly factor 1 subunit A
MEEFRRKIDDFFEKQNDSERPAKTTILNISEMCHIPPSMRSVRGIVPRYTVKEIMAILNEPVSDLVTAQNPVKILGSTRQKKRCFGPIETELLKSIPMKYLEFHEDVRPPYRGTFTKQPPADIVRSVSRNPTQRKLPNIDYDYDSEAVWDPEEEGEDLDSEGEQEDPTDDEADDMEGFLDDEDAPEASGIVNKRRTVMSDLIPVCSGLCWDDGIGVGNEELDNYKMEIILSMSLQHSAECMLIEVGCR